MQNKELFLQVTLNSKPKVPLVIISHDGKGNGEAYCEKGHKINGNSYSWICNTCGIEYMGPLLNNKQL